MKCVISTIVFLFVGILHIQASNDPIKDYLDSFSPLGGDRRVFSDDRLLRLDLDLNNDGKKEVLLSMARDRNGKQGNSWIVFVETPTGYSEVGGTTFNANAFFLGEVQEIGKYGIVSFWPAGAGEGTIFAHTFDGQQITETKIGEIIMDRKTFEYRGKELLDKYIGTNALKGNEAITTIEAGELAKKYGIKVESKTYEQALQEDLSKSIPTETPLSTPNPTHIEESTSAQKQSATHVTSSAAETKRSYLSFPVIATSIIAVVIVGIFLFFFRHKSS